MITPFELELGLGARDWESTYKLDIRKYCRAIVLFFVFVFWFLVIIIAVLFY